MGQLNDHGLIISSQEKKVTLAASCTVSKESTTNTPLRSNPDTPF